MTMVAVGDAYCERAWGGAMGGIREFTDPVFPKWGRDREQPSWGQVGLLNGQSTQNINIHRPPARPPLASTRPSTLYFMSLTTTTQTGAQMQNNGDYRKGPHAAPRMRSNQSVPVSA